MKKNKWSVEIRGTCKICGEQITKARFRTYCSTKCRVKFNNCSHSKQNVDRQRERRDKIASIEDPNKCQCLICGKWYVQLCTHAYQIHGVSGREYRQMFMLEVKKGIVPDWYRKLKGDIAIDNHTYENLKRGVAYRYKKGSETAGKYTRSPITIERLRNLHKQRKQCETKTTLPESCTDSGVVV